MIVCEVPVEMVRVRQCRDCGDEIPGGQRRLCGTCRAVIEYRRVRRMRERLAMLFAAQDFEGESPMPEEATDAVPGSDAKLLVMIARAERGECLHHPQDAGREAFILDLMERRPWIVTDDPELCEVD